MPNLSDQFGPIDIYLFDQLLRGRIKPGMCVLDAGCGGGRNLVYLLREGYSVFGADIDPRAVAEVGASSAGGKFSCRGGGGDVVPRRLGGRRTF